MFGSENILHFGFPLYFELIAKTKSRRDLIKQNRGTFVQNMTERGRSKRDPSSDRPAPRPRSPSADAAQPSAANLQDSEAALGGQGAPQVAKQTSKRRPNQCPFCSASLFHESWPPQDWKCQNCKRELWQAKGPCGVCGSNMLFGVLGKHHCRRCGDICCTNDFTGLVFLDQWEPKALGRCCRLCDAASESVVVAGADNGGGQHPARGSSGAANTAAPTESLPDDCVPRDSNKMTVHTDSIRWAPKQPHREAEAPTELVFERVHNAVLTARWVGSQRPGSKEGHARHFGVENISIADHESLQLQLSYFSDSPDTKGKSVTLESATFSVSFKPKSEDVEWAYTEWRKRCVLPEAPDAATWGKRGGFRKEFKKLLAQPADSQFCIDDDVQGAFTREASRRFDSKKLATASAPIQQQCSNRAVWLRDVRCTRREAVATKERLDKAARQVADARLFSHVAEVVFLDFVSDLEFEQQTTSRRRAASPRPQQSPPSSVVSPIPVSQKDHKDRLSDNKRHVITGEITSFVAMDDMGTLKCVIIDPDASHISTLSGANANRTSVTDGPPQPFPRGGGANGPKISITGFLSTSSPRPLGLPTVSLRKASSLPSVNGTTTLPQHAAASADGQHGGTTASLSTSTMQSFHGDAATTPTPMESKLLLSPDFQFLHTSIVIPRPTLADTRYLSPARPITQLVRWMLDIVSACNEFQGRATYDIGGDPAGGGPPPPGSPIPNVASVTPKSRRYEALGGAAFRPEQFHLLPIGSMAVAPLSFPSVHSSPSGHHQPSDPLQPPSTGAFRSSATTTRSPMSSTGRFPTAAPTAAPSPDEDDRGDRPLLGQRPSRFVSHERVIATGRPWLRLPPDGAHRTCHYVRMWPGSRRYHDASQCVYSGMPSKDHVIDVYTPPERRFGLADDSYQCGRGSNGVGEGPPPRTPGPIEMATFPRQASDSVADAMGVDLVGGAAAAAAMEDPPVMQRTPSAVGLTATRHAWVPVRCAIDSGEQSDVWSAGVLFCHLLVNGTTAAYVGPILDGDGGDAVLALPRSFCGFGTVTTTAGTATTAFAAPLAASSMLPIQPPPPMGVPAATTKRPVGPAGTTSCLKASSSITPPAVTAAQSSTAAAVIGMATVTSSSSNAPEDHHPQSTAATGYHALPVDLSTTPDLSTELPPIVCPTIFGPPTAEMEQAIFDVFDVGLRQHRATCGCEYHRASSATSNNKALRTSISAAAASTRRDVNDDPTTRRLSDEELRRCPFSATWQCVIRLIRAGMLVHDPKKRWSFDTVKRELERCCSSTHDVPA